MPDVKVKIESWNEVPAKRKRAFLSMTAYGGMMRDFTRKTKPMVFTAYLNGEHHGKKVGWATFSIDRGDAMLFVRETYRRRGVGTKLMNAIVNHAKNNNVNIRVYPHDGKSREFFNENRFPITHASASTLLDFEYATHYSSSLERPSKRWNR